MKPKCEEFPHKVFEYIRAAVETFLVLKKLENQKSEIDDIGAIIQFNFFFVATSACK